MTFEKRKAVLVEKMRDCKKMVDVAIDELSGQKVGYCVSSIDKSKTGEIQSIFVDAKYHGFGIGDTLIRKALAWMDSENVESKIVEVAAGNEDAFGFYGRYGFLPRKTLLKQTKTTHTH